MKIKSSLFISLISSLILFFGIFQLAYFPQHAFAASVPVDSYGAVGDGTTDDTSAIQNAIFACTPGDTVQFSAKTYYVSTLYLNSNCTYQGISASSGTSGTTLKLKAGPFIYKATDGKTGIVVDGITFDANNIGGAFEADGVGAFTNSEIRNSTFKNVSANAAYPSNVAIVSTYSSNGVKIANDTFTQLANGILFYAPSNLTVTGNTIDTITQGDWIETVNNNPGAPLPGIVVSNNTGKNVARMAIEIWNSTGYNAGGYDNPIIANNNFVWTSEVPSNAPYGISLSGTYGGGQVTGNTLIRSGNPPTSIGIEIVSADATVSGNTIKGFEYGIVLQGKQNVTIDSNTITDSALVGIEVANAGLTKNFNITRNTITNPHYVGIGIDVSSYDSSLIANNIISRAGGYWPSDATASSLPGWYGIKTNNFGAGAGPAFVRNNTIMQTAVNPPSTFVFWGFWVPSNQAGNTYTGNTVQSNSTVSFGSGFDLWSHTNLDGDILADNVFINLANITDGYSTAAIQKSNNVSYAVAQDDPNVVTTAYSFLPSAAPATSTVVVSNTPPASPPVVVPPVVVAPPPVIPPVVSSGSGGGGGASGGGGPITLSPLPVVTQPQVPSMPPVTNPGTNSTINPSSNLITGSASTAALLQTRLTDNLYFGILGYTNEVSSLQKFLNSKGYLSGTFKQGIFDASTREALKKYQCAQNIVCKGNEITTGWGSVGAQSRAKINAAIGSSSSNTGLSTSSGSNTISTVANMSIIQLQSLIQSLVLQVTQLQAQLLKVQQLKK